jgi:hypothetical protein
MAATRPGYRELALELEGRYEHVVFFNRYRIHKLADVSIIQVACAIPDEPFSESFSCAVSRSDLEIARASTLPYLDRLAPKAAGDPAKATSLPLSSKVFAANVVSCSYSGTLAEIALDAVSMKATAEASRNSSIQRVKTQGVAMLRSPVNIHVQLLFDLFAR